MSTVKDIVPVLSGAQRASMRAMIVALQHLPPLTLDVEIVGDSEQVVPFEPSFQLQPSTCVNLETTFTLLSSNGAIVPGIPPQEFGNSNIGGNVRFFTLLDPGVFTVNVKRTGISSTGVGTLERTFSLVAQVKPEPPPPPPPPPPPGRLVTCSVELTADPAGEGFTDVRIFGSGFQSGEQVNLLDENDEIIASPIANSFGGYQAINSFRESNLPSDHTVQAHGQTSGRVSNVAGFTL